METTDDILGEEKPIKVTDSLSTAADVTQTVVIDSLKGDSSDEDRNALVGETVIGGLLFPPFMLICPF